MKLEDNIDNIVRCIPKVALNLAALIAKSNKLPLSFLAHSEIASKA